MAIRTKHDGVWHRIDLAGKINTISFNIAPENWIESADGENFYFNYQIIGMLPSYSAIILFDFNQDGLDISAECITDNLKFSVTKKSDVILSGDIIYSNSGASAKIYFIGGMSDENINKATEKIASTLPIQRDEDGYTDIENFRQITKVAFSRNEEGNIIVDCTLQGDKSFQDIIKLDENGRPSQGQLNGVDWEIDWSNF